MNKIEKVMRKKIRRGVERLKANENVMLWQSIKHREERPERNTEEGPE